MSSFLTLSKEFIDYARQTNKQISGGEWVYRFWDDFIRETERSSEVVASAREGFDPTAVLFEREGVRRDTAPSREQRTAVAAITANGVGTCGAVSVHGTQDPGTNIELAHTLGRNNGQENAVYAWSLAVRRLTPIECERLQGFPDGHTAIQYRNRTAADSHRYKALGNSMAVPVITWLGKRIINELTKNE